MAVIGLSHIATTAIPWWSLRLSQYAVVAYCDNRNTVVMTTNRGCHRVVAYFSGRERERKREREEEREREKRKERGGEEGGRKRGGGIEREGEGASGGERERSVMGGAGTLLLLLGPGLGRPAGPPPAHRGPRPGRAGDVPSLAPGRPVAPPPRALVLWAFRT